MKKMKLLVVFLMATFTLAFCQPDKTFTVPVRLNGGAYIGTDSVLHLTWPTGTGSMVYPSAGIPLSTGSAWGTSIVNNSVAWNKAVTESHTAFLWGNHAGLYRPISYVPTYASITGKPTVFNPDLSVTNPLYKPIAWKPDYNTDILNVPEEVELDVAISQIKGIKPHGYTTAQIDALVMTAAEEGMEVYDLTLHVKKYWNGTIWKIIPTTN